MQCPSKSYPLSLYSAFSIARYTPFFSPRAANTSSRRNLFTQHTTRPTSCQSSSSFYGRAYLEDKWQPGEYLLPVRNEPSQQDIQSLLSQMQSAISTQIQKVQMSLDTLSGQVDNLVGNMSGIAEQLKFYQVSLSSSSSTDSEE
jgi:hypothetical protein